jgi:NAD(P)H-hydrate epimerase
VEILDIHLHPGFYASVNTTYEWIDEAVVKSIYKPRKKFAHKGNYGHALLVAGSAGKIGAAVLAARACMRSGVGLLFCHLPRCGYTIMQTSLPEAMVISDPHESITTKVEEDLTHFEAIGIGPGIGTAAETKMALREIFDTYRHPLVIDADGLNILASQKDLLHLVPPGSILTPHPKEFERLFGESANDFARIELALQKSRELKVIIVLKGHYSFIATPDKKGFFNSTGNPGMATAGSGDVLTGILTGLLAQGYSSVETALLGVYLHGLAGDIAAKKLSMEAMIAGDIIENLGDAYRLIC